MFKNWVILENEKKNQKKFAVFDTLWKVWSLFWRLAIMSIHTKKISLKDIDFFSKNLFDFIPLPRKLDNLYYHKFKVIWNFINTLLTKQDVSILRNLMLIFWNYTSLWMQKLTMKILRRYPHLFKWLSSKVKFVYFELNHSSILRLAFPVTKK